MTPRLREVAAVVADLFRHPFERRRGRVPESGGEAPRMQLIDDEIVGTRCSPRALRHVYRE